MSSMTQHTTDSLTNVCNGEQVSDAVVAAVAEATDTDPLDLEPLYNVVDSDALNSMFRSESGAPSSMEVRFTMAGCQVVVRGPDEVVASPLETADEDLTVVKSTEE